MLRGVVELRLGPIVCALYALLGALSDYGCKPLTAEGAKLPRRTQRLAYSLQMPSAPGHHLP